MRGMGFLPRARPTARAAAGRPKAVGKVGVGDSLSYRDFASGLAHLPDKRTCPVQVHRDVTKVLKLALKVLAYSLIDIHDL